MKRVAGLFLAVCAAVSGVLAGAVTNEVTEMVPFGDQFRARVVSTLEKYETVVNANATYVQARSTGAAVTNLTGTNSVKAPTITVTLQATTGYISDAPLTNAAGANIAIVTNVTVAITESFATNTVVVINQQTGTFVK